MQTVELLKLINSTLKTVNNNVYLDNAPSMDNITDTSAYPYVVYELQGSNFDEFEENINLVIDIWDYSKDSTAIETLADNIVSALNLLNKTCGTNLATFYFNSRQKIYDVNIELKRRQLQFTIQNIDTNDFYKKYI